MKSREELIIALNKIETEKEIITEEEKKHELTYGKYTDLVNCLEAKENVLRWILEEKDWDLYK